MTEMSILLSFRALRQFSRIHFCLRYRLCLVRAYRTPLMRLIVCQRFFPKGRNQISFSPRTGTWTLPPPTPNSPIDPTDMGPSFRDNHLEDRFTEDHKVPSRNRSLGFKKPLDPEIDRPSDKLARDLAEEVIQEFSRNWMSDLSNPEDKNIHSATSTLRHTS
ncbi:hypothetical protein BDZ97DRAFT_365148 [Flammula alnicola]|nr:hypothetical protein BDZ97DRAFT_365148 [Flammula alnicola]